MVILISVRSQIIKITKITLVEDDLILSSDAEIAETFNEYFIYIPILNMPNNQNFSTQTRSFEENTISGITERYKGHPSINLIKSKNNCLQGGHTISIKKFQDFSRTFQGKSLFFQGQFQGKENKQLAKVIF